jgi:hypothetical protein
MSNTHYVIVYWGAALVQYIYLEKISSCSNPFIFQGTQTRIYAKLSLLKEFGDVAREAKKVFIKYKMLGFYTNFASTLEKWKKID